MRIQNIKSRQHRAEDTVVLVTCLWITDPVYSYSILVSSYFSILVLRNSYWEAAGHKICDPS